MTDKTEAQPEALRVAAWLINAPFKTTHGDMLVGGRELRRLHAETETQAARIAELEAQLSARQAAPDGLWKCGHEYLPYHPDASHVDPAYRDGWNNCYRAAPPPPEREPLKAQEVHGLCESAGYLPGDEAKADFINGLRHGEMAHGIGATND